MNRKLMKMTAACVLFIGVFFCLFAPFQSQTSTGHAKNVMVSKSAEDSQGYQAISDITQTDSIGDMRVLTTENVEFTRSTKVTAGSFAGVCTFLFCVFVFLISGEMKDSLYTFSSGHFLPVQIHMIILHTAQQKDGKKKVFLQ